MLQIEAAQKNTVNQVDAQITRFVHRQGGFPSTAEGIMSFAAQLEIKAGRMRPGEHQAVMYERARTMATSAIGEPVTYEEVPPSFKTRRTVS